MAKNYDMIDKRTIETVITDQLEELGEKSDEALCFRREERLVDLNSTQAQVVIGVRRSGKSTLCFQALSNKNVKFAYVNFDDEKLADIKAAQLNDVLEALYKIYGDFKYLFLDEIQNIKGWHLFVNRLLRKKIHVIITGSNAKLLSGELATHLSGRSNEISMFPFSFGEFCEKENVNTTSMSTKMEAFRRAAFDKYMNQGGFPELFFVENKKGYVRNLVENVLNRDIIQRYKIRYKAAFVKFAHHLLNISPSIIATKELATTFNFKSEHTVRNYIDYLEQAYLLLGIQKYSQKSKQRLTQEKIYPIDVALMNQRDNAYAGENLGYRLETIVLIHLSRKCKLDGYDIYYLSERNCECDFVVCNGNTVVQAIQVSYNISAEKTYKREVRGLVMAAEKIHCKNLLLLTDSDSRTVIESGHEIKIQPVYEWCLEI